MFLIEKVTINRVHHKEKFLDAFGVGLEHVWYGDSSAGTWLRISGYVLMFLGIWFMGSLAVRTWEQLQACRLKRMRPLIAPPPLRFGITVLRFQLWLGRSMSIRASLVRILSNQLYKSSRVHFVGVEGGPLAINPWNTSLGKGHKVLKQIHWRIPA